jgi:hypothetical protein
VFQSLIRNSGVFNGMYPDYDTPKPHGFCRAFAREKSAAN